MEASYVSSRSESRGLPKRADSMGYVDNYESHGVAGRAAVAYLKEGQAMMKIVLIYMLGFLVVVAIVLFL